MTMDELKKKDNEGLKKLRSEKRLALKQFRFSVAGSQVRNVREGRQLKKDIARIETELTTRNQVLA